MRVIFQHCSSENTPSRHNQSPLFVYFRVLELKRVASSDTNYYNYFYEISQSRAVGSFRRVLRQIRCLSVLEHNSSKKKMARMIVTIFAYRCNIRVISIVVKCPGCQQLPKKNFQKPVLPLATDCHLVLPQPYRVWIWSAKFDCSRLITAHWYQTVGIITELQHSLYLLSRTNMYPKQSLFQHNKEKKSKFHL